MVNLKTRPDPQERRRRKGTIEKTDPQKIRTHRQTPGSSPAPCPAHAPTPALRSVPRPVLPLLRPPTVCAQQQPQWGTSARGTHLAQPSARAVCKHSPPAPRGLCRLFSGLESFPRVWFTTFTRSTSAQIHHLRMRPPVPVRAVSLASRQHRRPTQRWLPLAGGPGPAPSPRRCPGTWHLEQPPLQGVAQVVRLPKAGEATPGQKYASTVRGGRSAVSARGPAPGSAYHLGARVRFPCLPGATKSTRHTGQARKLHKAQTVLQTASAPEASNHNSRNRQHVSLKIFFQGRPGGSAV